MSNQKLISADLYLGLLFAQEDAGGRLIPGTFSKRRNRYNVSELERGRGACGCIHGAARLWAGPEHGDEAGEELNEAGIGIHEFDCNARHRLRLGLSVTVDSTLLDCGVEVKDEQ